MSMRIPTMQQAATVSLVAHLAIFLLVIIVAHRPPTLKPIVYNVSIVTPEAPKKNIAKKPEAPPPQPKKEAAPAEPENRQRVVPKPPKPENRQKVVPKTKPAPEPEPKPAPKPKPEPKPAEPSLEEIKARTVERIARQKQLEEEQREQKRKELEEEQRRQEALKKAAALGAAATQASSKAEHDRILEEYSSQIQTIITDQWVYPDIAGVTKLQAGIAITVFSNGSIRVDNFLQPSGNKVFDRSCLKAISDAGTMPPTPYGETLEVVIQFHPPEELN